MLGSQLGNRANYIRAAVRRESAGDHLECASEGFVRPLLNASQGLCFLLKSAGELHFKSTTAWKDLGVKENIAADSKSVL